jgi:uncharacterized protein
MEPDSDPSPPSETERLPPMTHYVLGLLRRPAELPVISQEEVDRIQESHLAHLRHLSETGELIAAGPLEEDFNVRGVLVFSTSSVDRARELSATDPALTNGRLTLDLYTWLAPAGLRVGPAARNPTELDFQTD